MCYSCCNRYLSSLCLAYLIREITNFINVIIHRCNIGIYFAWPKVDRVEHEVQLNTISLIVFKHLPDHCKFILLYQPIRKIVRPRVAVAIVSPKAHILTIFPF